MAVINPNIKWLQEVSKTSASRIEIGGETYIVSVDRVSDNE